MRDGTLTGTPAEQERVTPLLGRDLELRRLGALLESAQAETRGGALLVSGEAGIGKSAVLEWSVETAIQREMQVLSTIGVATETALPFAGLHRVLRPVLADVDALPPPQRDALLAAFGITDAAAPELFLTALGVLTLLTEAASTSAILLIIDDAQWLDRETAEVLSFVARRLESEPIVLLIAVRSGLPSAFEQAALPALPLDPLPLEPASAVLKARFPHLSPALRDRTLREAAGNPLALVELPVGAVEAGANGSPRAHLPLSARLEQAFASRLSGLTAKTRSLMLVAAANDGDSLAELLAAGQHLQVSEVELDDLEGAVAARLVVLENATLRFRHPLVRSAIYQGAASGERRAAHAALADVLSGDADRTAWHRAEASPGPDDEVAQALEGAAVRAQGRGALATAVVGLERAARLSVDPVHRTRRLLVAIDVAEDLGDGQVVLRLLDMVAEQDLTAEDQRWVANRRSNADAALTLSSAGFVSRLEAAERAATGGDIAGALRLLLDAASVAWMLDAPWSSGRERIVAAVERLPLDPGDPRAMVVLAMAAPIERGAVVLERVRRRGHEALSDPVDAQHLAWAASVVGDFDVAIAASRRASTELRAQGRLGRLARTLSSLGWAAFHVGDFRLAVVANGEAERLASDSAQPYVAVLARAATALTDAMRGNPDRALGAAAALEAGALAFGARAVLAQARLARGLVALSEGQMADAYGHLRRIYERDDPAHHPHIQTLAVADLVEASVHAGTQHDARPIVERMEQVAVKTRSPPLLAGLAFARPLLAPDAEAEELFTTALRQDLMTWPLLRARMDLAFGRWLRRQRRVADSRLPLRAAVEAFTALDAGWWSERAARELRASGGAARPRVPAGYDALTPQELQIAQLAADGLTNQEIGQDLFISHRTVSTHLYRIFRKFGLTARSQLPAALEAAGAPTP